MTICRTSACSTLKPVAALRRFGLAALAALAMVSGGALQAQTKPKVLDLGPDTPRSVIYIGNSFFYYNNSLHGHVTQLLQGSTPAVAMRSSSVTISGSGSLTGTTLTRTSARTASASTRSTATTMSCSTSSTNCSTWPS